MKLNEIANNKQPKLIVLVGLPGSGKSTWINNFLNSTNEEYEIISSDNILEKIAKEQSKTYSDVYNDNVDKAISTMNSNATEAIKNRKNIIWDQTNMTAGKRKSILSRFPKNYYKIAVVFEIDDNELKNRLNKREKETGKSIPSHVIDNMRKNYQPPNLNTEDFNEIIKV